MAELITCQSIGYRQQGNDILADIDWRIERGQHWAVLGPNGSGKTTLLRIVCGYLWPTSGRVLRLGRELLDLSELRRSIGWISSGMIAEIPPGDTGLETVVIGSAGANRPQAVAVVRANRRRLCRLRPKNWPALGCESLANKPFGVLSQGERQQVLIARARMARPLLLVLDEPCAGMDPGVRERFLGWLDERIKNDEARMTNDECEIRTPGIRHSSFVIRHSTPTTVLVTHHIEEIVPGIRNTLVLSGGRVHAAGRTSAVVTLETIETVYGTRLAHRSQRRTAMANLGIDD